MNDYEKSIEKNLKFEKEYSNKLDLCIDIYETYLGNCLLSKYSENYLKAFTRRGYNIDKKTAQLILNDINSYRKFYDQILKNALIDSVKKTFNV